METKVKGESLQNAATGHADILLKQHSFSAFMVQTPALKTPLKS